MKPRTRLDKVVWVKERAEDAALAGFARARAASTRARALLEEAKAATQVDARRAAPVELWHVDELARLRALQAVRTAEGVAEQAAQVEARALHGYQQAHVAHQVVTRVQEKKQREIQAELDRKERRTLDEQGTARFNTGS